MTENSTHAEYRYVTDMISISDVTSVINQFLPEPHAGLLSGILFGTKATLSFPLKDALIKTGTLHIVALSGTNITIIIGVLGTMLLQVFPRKIAYIGAIIGIIGFVWFVGPSASVVRAALMGIIALIGVLCGRQSWAFFTWGIAIVMMLIVRPMWIIDVSFQLSALASLGMILFGKKSVSPHTGSFWLYGKALLIDELHTTLAAQVLTIPLIVFLFHRISFIAPLTNILIGWAIPVITVLGFIVVALGMLWYPFGYGAALITWVFLEYVITMITVTSWIPLASVGW